MSKWKSELFSRPPFFEENHLSGIWRKNYFTGYPSTFYNIKAPHSTMFENHRKSLIQQCERSDLRLHIEWTLVHKKCQNSHFGEFLNNLSLGSNSFTRQRTCCNWKLFRFWVQFSMSLKTCWVTLYRCEKRGLDMTWALGLDSLAL